VIIAAGLFVLSYLVGAFPSALVVGRLARGIDIRRHGSGNMGAANVFRVLGARWGILVAIVDIAKGCVPPFFLAQPAAAATNIDSLYLQIAFGLVAVLGHVFTVFAGFRGGKGVLTGLGVLVALLPFEALIAMAVFAVVFGLFRIVSLGSLSAAFALCITVVIEKFFLKFSIHWALVLTCVFLLILVLITHRSNIKRLMAGTEPAFKRPRS